MPYGRTVLGQTGVPCQAIATDLDKARFKVGGVTIDWSTVTAVSADTTLPDGTVIPNGYKYLRYGQVLCRINTAEVQTVEWTGGPTGGSAVIRVTASGSLPGGDTAPIAYNATAAAFEAALDAVIGTDNASVARTGAGSNADPYIYTVTWNPALGDVPALTSPSNTFTGGTSPSVTIATGTAGTGTGLWGPYDPAATDGRQTLTRGEVFILNETLVEKVLMGWGVTQYQNPSGAFDAASVWKGRLLATSGTHSLAAGPTFTELLAVMPELELVEWT